MKFQNCLRAAVQRCQVGSEKITIKSSLLQTVGAESEVDMLNRTPTTSETDRVEIIAQVCGVDTSVAHDIDYLRRLERRIITAAKNHPHIRDFKVENRALENQLAKLEK